MLSHQKVRRRTIDCTLIGWLPRPLPARGEDSQSDSSYKVTNKSSCTDAYIYTTVTAGVITPPPCTMLHVSLPAVHTPHTLHTSHSTHLTLPTCSISEEEELDEDAIERRREIMRERARQREMEEVGLVIIM